MPTGHLLPITTTPADERERILAEAEAMIADLHKQRGLTPPKPHKQAKQKQTNRPEPQEIEDALRGDAPLDFSGKDLSGMNLRQIIGSQVATIGGADFTGADLSNVDMRGMTFNRCKFDGALMSRIAAQEAKFTDCTFDKATGNNAGFEYARFEGCDLSAATFGQDQEFDPNDTAGQGMFGPPRP